MEIMSFTRFADEYLIEKAKAFEKASKMLLDPAFLESHNSIALKFIAKGRLGNDVVDWVQDLEHFEKTGRKRYTI